VIVDIGPVAVLTKFSELQLFDNQINDIRDLTSLTNFSLLKLNGNLPIP